MSLSPFNRIEQAPADPILGLTEAFLADPNPNKVNLGVGVYQDASGKVPVLKAVREAEKRWFEREDSKSYLPIDGAPAYNKAVQTLLFGAGSEVISTGRAVTVQALGGTGALRVGADLLRRFFPDSGVYLSTPSWENHRALFEAAGFPVSQYPYYNPDTHAVEFGQMLDALRAVPEGSIVVLHACCHNPTGVDLTDDQWTQVAEACTAARAIPFLDFAYQGFGAGLEQDAFAVRAFAAAGRPYVVASSFSKSLSLYRERVGAFTLVAEDASEAKRVLSQLKRTIRTNYSSPSSHGAQAAAMVLTEPDLRPIWEQELTEMRERIVAMRARFVQELRDLQVSRDFGFIAQQRGMFSFSGIDLEAVRRLRSEFGIYAVDSGRICVAALNERNLPAVCRAIAAVVG